MEENGEGEVRDRKTRRIEAMNQYPETPSMTDRTLYLLLHSNSPSFSLPFFYFILRGDKY